LGKTAPELDRISGSLGEIFLDSTNQTLRLYDGRTTGGTPLGGGSGSSSLTTEQVQDIAAGLFNTAQSGVTVSYNDPAARITLTVSNQTWSQITSKPTFATVATSGSYDDLTNKPTIPTNTSQLINGAGFITSVGTISYNDLTTRPTIPTNTNQLTNGAGFLTSVGTISYNDLTNRPTIPAAYSATSINALSDVDTVTAAPTANQPLVWNAVSSSWVPGAVPSLTTLSGVTITSPTAGQVLKYNGSNWINDVDATSGGAGVGTVTNVSVTSANGFTGSVATASSTPAITITTSITGLLKGNGTAISAAVAGTDYLTSITSSNVTTALGFTPYNATNPSGYITTNGIPSQTGNSGRVLSTDGTALSWTVAATGSVASVSVVSANGFTGTVATSTTTPAITITTSITGVLKGNGTAVSAAVAGTDYQVPITLTTTGSSGAATFSNGTLNIPQYSGGGAEADTLATVTGRGATTAVAVRITNATSSTTTTSGALVVSGGVGVGGNLYIGGTADLNGISIGNTTISRPNNNLTLVAGGAQLSRTSLTLVNNYGAVLYGGSASVNAPESTTYGIILAGGSGNVSVPNSTASSSTTTGALVVSGGVGVAGAIYAGNIYSNGTQLTAGVTAFSGLSDATSAGLTVDELYLQAATRLNVTNNSTTAYRFDQYGTTDDPTIYATSGTTIAFNLNVSGHPFLIRTSGGSNYNDGLVHVSTAGVVSTGSSAQGQVSGTLYWKIPSSISGAYQYICSIHSGMVGVITINPLAVTATSVGLGNVTNESKATMFASPSFTGTATVNNTANGVHVQTQVNGVNTAALGSFNGAPTVGSNLSGYSAIMFNGASIEPTLDGLNVRQSALVDIGSTNYRFKIGHFTGINFPATQSASSDANTLDDYEEGTYTVTLTPINSGTITLSNNIGHYTKIGRVVTVGGQVSVSAVSSPTGAYVNLNVTFTSAAFSAGTGRFGFAVTAALGGSAWATYAAGLQEASTDCVIEQSASTFTTGTSIRFQFSYFV
jgi:plastocyanin